MNKHSNKKPILLHYDEIKHNLALTKHQSFMEALNELAIEIEILLNRALNKVERDELAKEPESTLEKLIMAHYNSANSLNIPFVKLVDLMQIDVSKAKSCISKMHTIGLTNYNKPSRKAFEMVARTDKQIKRYEILKNIIDSVYELKELEAHSHSFFVRQWALGSGNTLRPNDKDLTFHPYFVLNGFRS